MARLSTLSLSLLAVLTLGACKDETDPKDSNAGDDTAAPVDTSDTASGDTEDTQEPEIVCTPVDLREGDSGTYTYTGGEDDRKHHWNMPANITEVKSSVTWTDTTWTVQFKMGKGECPHSGTSYDDDSNNTGTVALDTFAADVTSLDGLFVEGAQHFIHIAPPSTTGLTEGDTFDYTVAVEVCGPVAK